MRKIDVRINIIVIILLSVLCFGGCGNSDRPSTKDSAIESSEKNNDTVAGDNTLSTAKDSDKGNNDTASADESGEESENSKDSSREDNTVDKMSASDLITGYDIIKNDASVSDDQHTIIAYASLPRLTGQAEYIDEINDILQKINDDYFKTYASEAQNNLDMMKEYEYSDEFLLSPVDTDSVYWDEAGNVSIGTYWRWYMGGVYNQGYGSVNYNIFSKTHLTIEEVLGKNRDEIDIILADKITEYFGVDYSSEELNSIETYKFWFDADMVYVGFDSYELEGFGNFYSVIEIPR